jgi:hypothetical protein
MRKAVIVSARKCNDCCGIKRIIITAIDLVYIITDESICAIMEDNSRMVCNVYDLV